MNDEASVQFNVKFEKAESTGRYVRGFASVIEEHGVPVGPDFQGDVIEMSELRKAAHQYVTDARIGKVMHSGEHIADVVESVLIDDDFAKALGLTDSRRGWWIGMEIHSEAVQKRVLSGELKAFSIGGKGTRVPAE